MSDRLGLPVQVENDANLGALAEHRFGAGLGSDSLAYLKVATGIGAGLIVEGRLFRGAGGTAGEIGHTIVDETGDVCRCGNRGCLETVAADGSLLALLRPAHGDDLTVRGMLELVSAPSPARACRFKHAPAPPKSAMLSLRFLRHQRSRTKRWVKRSESTSVRPTPAWPCSRAASRR